MLTWEWEWVWESRGRRLWGQALVQAHTRPAGKVHAQCSTRTSFCLRVQSVSCMKGSADCHQQTLYAVRHTVQEIAT